MRVRRPPRAVVAVLLLSLCLPALHAVAAPPVADRSQTARATAVTPQRARSLYLLHCAGCHQIDGSGTPRFGVPTMIDTLGQFQRTAAGRAFLVQVPGARNANVSDAELAALTNWALNTFSARTLPIGFKPYTMSEVRRWRADPPLDITAARTEVIGGLAGAPALTNGGQRSIP